MFRGRIVGPGEPLWLDDDRATALAYRKWLREDEATRCPRCRTRESDWIDPESGRPLRDPLWEAVIRECAGCAEAVDVEGDMTDEQRRDGAHVIFRPFDPDHEPECIPSDEPDDITLDA